jgi:hypothetical protein
MSLPLVLILRSYMGARFDGVHIFCNKQVAYTKVLDVRFSGMLLDVVALQAALAAHMQYTHHNARDPSSSR